MTVEPLVKRAISFIDGQNLYHPVREAFDYSYPNYDVVALSKAICRKQNWDLTQVRFYTGVPDASDDPFWNSFWHHKLAMLGRQKVFIYSRTLRYRHRLVRLPSGTEQTVLAGEEKGIDVRMAIDIIRLAHHKEYDVALIFSQDQDLSEVAMELRIIAAEQDRWIKAACAYPVSQTTRNRWGIDKTDWIQINRATYDTCIDPRDYRLKGSHEDQ